MCTDVIGKANSGNLPVITFREQTEVHIVEVQWRGVTICGTNRMVTALVIKEVTQGRIFLPPLASAEGSIVLGKGIISKTSITTTLTTVKISIKSHVLPLEVVQVVVLEQDAEVVLVGMLEVVQEQGLAVVQVEVSAAVQILLLATPMAVEIVRWL